MNEYKNLLKNKKKESMWRKIVTILCSVTVFCTVYALILPAITLTNDTDDVVEHVHNEDCFTYELTCTNEYEEHVHIDECYEKTLICAQELDNPSFEEIQSYTLDEELLDEEEFGFDFGVSLMSLDSEGVININQGLSIDIDDCIDLSTYLLNEEASYFDSTANDWESITDGVKLEGDEPIKYGFRYLIPTETLKTKGKMIYKLPDWMEDFVEVTQRVVIELEGGLHDEVATLYIKDGYAIIVMDDDWQSHDVLSNMATISSSVTVDAKLNAGEIAGGDSTISIGGTNIHIDLPTDALSHFGNIEIDKTVSKLVNPSDDDYVLTGEYAGKSYIEYTIKVSVGEDGDIPDVKILDYLTNSEVTKYNTANNGSRQGYSFSDYIIGVADVTGTSQPVNALDDVNSTNQIGNVYLTSNKTPQTVAREGDTPGYIVTEPSGTNADPKKDALVWEVGDLEKNKEYTLTYKLVVSDLYTGFHHGTQNDIDGGVIHNQADLYSNNYKRDNDTAEYSPNGDLKIKKMSSEPVYDEATQTFLIKYRVAAYAPLTNDYTMTDVKINDVYSTTGVGTNYIHYQATQANNTLKLYKGGIVATYDTNGNEILEFTEPGEEIYYTTEEGKEIAGIVAPYRTRNPEIGTQSMTFIIGELAPGESKTIEYSMVVDRDAFLNNNSGAANIRNTAEIYDDEKKSPERYGSKLGQEVNNNQISLKHWIGKISGEHSLNAKEITIQTGDGIQYFNKNKQEITSDIPGSFPLAANNMEYKIVVNQAGDWNVSNALLQDRLNQVNGKDVLKFVGYAKICGYDLSKLTDAQRSSLATMNDTQAYNFLSSLGDSYRKIVYVDINDLKTFSYQMTDLGFDSKPEMAYTINYFTELVNPSITHLNVRNDFSISGDVTYGNGTDVMTIPGITVSRTETFTGTNNYSFDKIAWYYDDSKISNEGDFSNGELYWILKVTGSGVLPKDAAIRDYVENANGSSIGSNTIVEESSFVDLFVGPNYSNVATQYKSIDSLINNAGLTKINQAGNYAVTYGLNAGKETMNFVVTNPDGISIGNNRALYLIVKTSPDQLPQQMGVKRLEYRNTAEILSPDTGTWESKVTKSQNIMASYGITKDAQGVYFVKDLTGQAGRNVKVEKLNGDGSTSNHIQQAERNSDFLHYLSKDFTIYNLSTREIDNSLYKGFTYNGRGNSSARYEGWYYDCKYVAGNEKYGAWNDSGDDRYLLGNYKYDDGTYLVWNISLNEGNDLSTGQYSIVDTLPEGVELAYIRSYNATNNFTNTQTWTGPLEHNGRGNAEDGWKYNFTARSDKLEADDNWQFHVVASRCDANGSGVTAYNHLNYVATYYYTNDNKIQIYCPYVRNDKGAFTFQIVCKVTDPDVLQGGIEKTFVNHAQLFTGDNNEGQSLSTVSAPITLSVKTLNKDSIDSSANGAILPYRIIANEKGEDLNPKGDSITIVDELSSSLNVILSTIKVEWLGINDVPVLLEQTTDKAIIDNPDLLKDENKWFASYSEGSTPGTMALKITVPDDKRIRITYNTRVNALPGESISISNSVFYEGYAGGGEVVEDNDYEFSSSVIIDSPLTVSIRKMDSETLNPLRNAKFDVYEVNTVYDSTKHEIVIAYNEDGTPKISSTSLATGITGSDGRLYFKRPGSGDSTDSGYSNSDYLEHNKIYCLKETAAPTGYVLDAEPHYFVVLQKYQDTPLKYPVVKNPFNELRIMTGTNYYEYEAINHVGWINVQKSFSGNRQALAGNYRFGLWSEDNMLGTTPNGNPDQVISIDFSHDDIVNKISKKGTFKNLDITKQYYVFELDDSLKPIVPVGNVGKGVINGQYTSVTYDYNLVQLSSTEVPMVSIDNGMYEASVSKTFDLNRKIYGAITGTYKFGLYGSTIGEDGKVLPLLDEPIETVNLRWLQSESMTVEEKVGVFSKLEKDKYYFIFEMDDNNQPILGDSKDANISGKVFSVTYSNETIIQDITIEQYQKNLISTKSENSTNSLKVNVKNKAIYATLPETGGSNNILNLATIVTFAVAVVYGLKTLKNKRRLI